MATTTQNEKFTRTTFGTFVLVTLATDMDHELYEVSKDGSEMFVGYLAAVDTDLWSAHRSSVQDHCSTHTNKFHPEALR